jgi:hypothetical protein
MKRIFLLAALLLSPIVARAQQAGIPITDSLPTESSLFKQIEKNLPDALEAHAILQVSSSYARKLRRLTSDPSDAYDIYFNTSTGKLKIRTGAATWANASGETTSPAGSSGDIQYNNAGAFGGSLLHQSTNTIEQYNSTNAQAFRLYSSFTDTSNYTRLSIQYNSGDTAFEVYPQKAGTGIETSLVLASSNAGGTGVYFRTANTYRWQVNSNGHILPVSNNAYTIGSASSKASEMWGTKFCYTTSVCDFFGSGTPEASVTANVGSTYRRTDGGAGASFYVKESGTGNTGWVAK